MTTGAAVGHDMAVLEAMAAEMEPYLKSTILYWQLSPEQRISPPPPLLTIGGTLLRARRLEALRDTMEPEEAARLGDARAQFDQAIGEWPAHAARKIVHELDARLNSWRRYVADCQMRDRSCLNSFPSEAEKRTIVELLLDEGKDLIEVGPFRAQARALDGQFRAYFSRDDFVWDERLRTGFPKERFWWLYGRPEIREGTVGRARSEGKK